MGRYYSYSRQYRPRYYRSGRIPELGGIDDDVLRLFNNFNWDRRQQLLRFYALAHGGNAARYAQSKLEAWATGAVNASDQTRVRLLRLVPKVLNHSERYELLKKLYSANRASNTEVHYLTVLVGYVGGVRNALKDLAVRLCNKPVTVQLPASVQSRIAWVCDEDSEAARKLMAAIETEESVAIARAGMIEVDRLINAIESSGSSVEGTHTLELPYGKILVQVRHPGLFERIVKSFTS